ncbi:hypothetical protein JW758_00665 [Candidatus Peregrinibacteria bacterium]|nr:hypothetical protein [Candidatus Peregrinibacteria bacterium]
MEKNNKTIEVAYLNTVYCTDGKSLAGFLRTHYHHVVGRRDDRIARFANPQIALDFVEDTGKPDIVALSEILGKKQRNELMGGLKELGYPNAHYGKGQKLSGKEGYDEMYDEIVIASMHEIERLKLPKITQTNTGQHGNGGGIAAIRLPEFDLDVISAHLPVPNREKSYAEQIGIVNRMKESAGSRFLAIGDYNFTPEVVSKNHPEFVEGLELLSSNEPTCSTVVPIRQLICDKCFDQAWGRGLEQVSAKAVMAQSDHKGIVVELKLN